jgi:hypothetical protein
VASALRRHLEQFPSTANGLSCSEEQALEAIDSGSSTVAEAFVAHQEREEPLFLSDAVFASYMKDLGEKNLGDAREPLVLLEEGGAIGDPLQEGSWDRQIVLTEKGREVLRGDEDRVRLVGIERWLGGVQLDGETPWRWDRATQTLKRDAA